MPNSINDELTNKVFHLYTALNHAEKAIKLLEQQNLCLKDALANLASTNNEDYEKCLENSGEQNTQR